MDRYIGRLLDNRYEILEVIGTGGMAVVYKARCHRLNRLVAIKILKDENYQDADFRRRFHAEGQAVGMLSHPNIVSVYDVATCKEADYIVMELIDGISLKQYMEKKGVLNWKETLHFASQIAKALEHAHSKGLVHRDIKPHNVMVLKNGAVRVTDFGIARVTANHSTLTKEALGSVHYISPEQAKGGRVDCRSDLYSLGVVMYEMITGRPPFDGESPVTVALQHIAGGAARPSVLNPNIPKGLEQIIMKAMAHEPKDRYPNAAAMLADLDAVRVDPDVVFTPEHLAGIPPKPVEVPAEEPVQEEKEVKPAAKPAKKPKDDAAQKAVRKKQPKSREERELSRDRVTTLLIVFCAMAAMVAVIVCLGTWLRNAEQPAVKMVNVPKVVGVHYERLPDYDVQIIRQSTAYSDEYSAGVIIRQLPEAGTSVEIGSKVFVVVSLGKEPETVAMPDLSGMTETEARIYLSGLHMNLKVEVEEQQHDTVPKGEVISTTPAAKTTLWEGATVTLYMSAGKQILTARMPNLLQGGAAYKDMAQATMEQRGFTNVRWVPVDSTLPAGRIISQSVPANEEVDVNTLIVIEYASGKAPTVFAKMPNLVGMDLNNAQFMMDLLQFTNVQWVPVDSAEPFGTVLTQSELADEQVDINHQIVIEYSNAAIIRYTITGLPARARTYLLTMTYTDAQGQTQYILVDQEIQPGETSFTVELSGEGQQKYMLYIDGAYFKTITVDFGTDEPEQPVQSEPTEPVDPTQPTQPEQPEQEETDQVEDGQ